MESLIDQKKSTGRIIKVQKEKGFGFIISDEHRFVKFFFHWTSLGQGTDFKTLEEGMTVNFIPLQRYSEMVVIDGIETKKDRGPRAIQVEVISERK